MRTILIVVHGFADIVQEAALFGEFHIRAKFCGENTCQLGNFHRVRELILTIRCAEFQAPHHA